MTDEALNIFDNIVELVDQETSRTQPKILQRPSKQQRPKRRGGEEAESADAKADRPKAAVPKAVEHQDVKSPPKPDFPRIHSKARVQKSIRFQPVIIAELEDHLRSLELVGQQRSLQDVMNEALELWLRTNVRSG